MKIRNGFVSNSSSSSFVILGVKRNGDSEEIMENEHFGNKIESLWVECDYYDFITGIIISDGEEIDETTTSFVELRKMSETIATALNVDIDKVELITGCRPC